MANIIFDIILAVILLVGVIWGLKAGFIKAIAKPTKFVLAILLAIMLCSVVGESVIKPMIQEPIVTKLSEALTEKIGETIGDAEELPTLVKFAAELAGIDMSLITDKEAQADMVDAVLVAVTDPVLNLISSVIAFILLYIILKICVGLLFSLINSIVDNGPIGAVNRALGCAVMTLFAFMVAWVLCMMSDFILNIPIINQQAWVQDFSGGWLYNIFRSLSPVDIILGLLLSF